MLQVRQLSATALVGVEARPVPDKASLQQLAHYTSDILKAHGSTFLQPDAVLKAVSDAGRSLAAASSHNTCMYDL